MTTSGTTTFDMTARDLIAFALRKINITSSTDSVTAEDAERGRLELNMMLKGWQKHRALWLKTEGSLPLTASTQSYTLSPVPYRVVSCRYRNAAGTDLPMYEMTRDEYMNLPQKGSAGTPTSYYFDPQRASGVLYVWPVIASPTTETIKYTYQRRFEDVTNLTQTLDMPPEALEVAAYNLAARIADDYGQAGPNIGEVKSRAMMLFQEHLDTDRPDTIRFMPDARNA